VKKNHGYLKDSEVFSTGNFPKTWRKTKVVSILKLNKLSGIAGSNRSISLLFCVRKLFEKVICNRLQSKNWSVFFTLRSVIFSLDTLQCWNDTPVFTVWTIGSRGLTSSYHHSSALEKVGEHKRWSLFNSHLRLSFERKEKTLAAFLDISEVHNWNDWDIVKSSSS
jgi:hypothetical protein